MRVYASPLPPRCCLRSFLASFCTAIRVGTWREFVAMPVPSSAASWLPTVDGVSPNRHRCPAAARTDRSARRPCSGGGCAMVPSGTCVPTSSTHHRERMTSSSVAVTLKRTEHLWKRSKLRKQPGRQIPTPPHSRRQFGDGPPFADVPEHANSSTQTEVRGFPLRCVYMPIGLSLSMLAARWAPDCETCSREASLLSWFRWTSSKL